MKPLDPNHADNYPAPDNSEGNDWRQACPRCSECGKPIDEDVGCQDADCLADREPCGIANPGGTPCTKPEGHTESHDPDAYGPMGQDDEAIAGDIDQVIEQVAWGPINQITSIHVDERQVYPAPITIPQMRAAILDVIDAGDMRQPKARWAWLFYLDETDAQTETRMRFVDAVQKRLSELSR